MNRSGGTNVGHDAGHPDGGFADLDVLLEAGQLDARIRAGIVKGAASGRGVLAAGLISVQRVGCDSKKILHGERDPGGHVVFEFGEGNHDIRLFIGLVEVE